MKKVINILMLLLCTSCLSLKEFIEQKPIFILDHDRVTRNKPFIVYIEQDIRKEIFQLFPDLDKQLKGKEFDLEIRFLVTSNVNKDILWFDSHVEDYLDNMTKDDIDMCSSIRTHLYKIIQPKFYPTLIQNKPKRSNMGKRSHKFPARVALFIEFKDGDFTINYPLRPTKKGESSQK